MTTLVLATLAVLLPAATPVLAQDIAGPVMPLPDDPVRFEITYDASLGDSFSGRVVVVLGTSGRADKWPRWTTDEPVFVRTVEGWKPDTPLIVDASTARLSPISMEQFQSRKYVAQAFMEWSKSGSRPAAIGNAQSTAGVIEIDPRTAGAIAMRIDQRIEIPTWEGMDNRERLDSISFRSPMLSEHRGEDVNIEIVVARPIGYELQPDRVWPTRYWFTNLHADPWFNPRTLKRWDLLDGGADLITVSIGCETATGHSLVVDSEFNGPWQTAFMEEVLPMLEDRYQFDPAGRFVSGHGFGGRVALSLMAAYPDEFLLCWAASPFGLDFTMFHGVDISRDANMYFEATGQLRPFMRDKEGNLLRDIREQVRREMILDGSGRFDAFDAAFSPLDADGNPMHLFDRTSGAIDQDVAAAWLARDVKSALRELCVSRPDVAERVTIHFGSDDNYFLNEVGEGMQRDFREVAPGLEVRMYQEKGHANFMQGPFQRETLKVMLDAYKSRDGAVKPEAAGPTPPAEVGPLPQAGPSLPDKP